MKINIKIKSFFTIFLLFFIFLNFYFFFYSNNKYSKSFLFEKQIVGNKFFIINNDEEYMGIINKIIAEIPNLDISIKKYENDVMNQFLSEGFLCMQENHLFIDEYISKFKDVDKSLIKSLSLQGGYFYNRKFIDKVLIKFNHSSSINKANKSFFDYFNFCFAKSYKSHNIIYSYVEFINSEIKKYEREDLIYELNMLKQKKIEIKDFNYLLKPFKNHLNYYYYFSLICFGFTLCILLNSIFYSFFIKKTK